MNVNMFPQSIKIRLVSLDEDDDVLPVPSITVTQNDSTPYTVSENAPTMAELVSRVFTLQRQPDLIDGKVEYLSTGYRIHFLDLASNLEDEIAYWDSDPGMQCEDFEYVQMILDKSIGFQLEGLE